MNVSINFITIILCHFHPFISCLLICFRSQFPFTIIKAIIKVEIIAVAKCPNPAAIPSASAKKTKAISRVSLIIVLNLMKVNAPKRPNAPKILFATIVIITAAITVIRTNVAKKDCE